MGKQNDDMTLGWGSLDPSTSYDILIENVIKDPLSGEFIFSDINSIVTTTVTTLEGAEVPEITKNPPATTTAIEGDTAIFSMTGKTSLTDNSYYRWYELYSDTLYSDEVKGKTLVAKSTTGTKTHTAEVKASSANDNDIFYAQLLSENNGDIIVVTSEKSVLDVVKNSDDKDESSDRHDGNPGNGNTGDTTKIIVLGLLLLLALVGLVLALHHRKK